jgi:hypothetical protein
MRLLLLLLLLYRQVFAHPLLTLVKLSPRALLQPFTHSLLLEFHMTLTLAFELPLALLKPRALLKPFALLLVKQPRVVLEGGVDVRVEQLVLRRQVQPCHKLREGFLVWAVQLVFVLQ